jgi:hypothetical protein
MKELLEFRTLYDVESLNPEQGNMSLTHVKKYKPYLVVRDDKIEEMLVESLLAELDRWCNLRSRGVTCSLRLQLKSSQRIWPTPLLGKAQV